MLMPSVGLVGGLGPESTIDYVEAIVRRLRGEDALLDVAKASKGE